MGRPSFQLWTCSKSNQFRPFSCNWIENERRKPENIWRERGGSVPTSEILCWPNCLFLGRGRNGGAYFRNITDVARLCATREVLKVKEKVLRRICYLTCTKHYNSWLTSMQNKPCLLAWTATNNNLGGDWRGGGSKKERRHVLHFILWKTQNIRLLSQSEQTGLRQEGITPTPPPPTWALLLN